MNITPTDTYTVHEYRAEDAPELPPHKYQRVTIIPREVTFRSRNGLVEYACIKGPARRRDGTVGTHRHTESVAQESTADGWHRAAPDWVLNLVADAGLTWGSAR